MWKCSRSHSVKSLPVITSREHFFCLIEGVDLLRCGVSEAVIASNKVKLESIWISSDTLCTRVLVPLWALIASSYYNTERTNGEKITYRIE